MAEDAGLPLTALTWAALLARWTEFARASVAFPKDAEGTRWRASVAPVIGLQSVAFALSEADALVPDERALGLDRAGVLVRAHAGELHRVWRGEAMPDALREVVDDAHRTLTLARSRGVEFRVAVERWEAPDLLPLLERARPGGVGIEFALAVAPGTTVFRGEPAMFVRPAIDLSVEGLTPVASPPRQVYRQQRAEGVRDVVAHFDDALQPGATLLRVVIDRGRVAPGSGAHGQPSRARSAEVVEKPLDDDRA